MALTNQQAAIVKGMLKRGQDRHSDIAARFKVNHGRITEIAKGRRFATVKAAPEDMLPPAEFETKIPKRKPRGTNRQIELHEITRASGRAIKNIERLFMEKCKKYKPLRKDEADHLFYTFQELGTHYIKLAQNVSNYQQGEDNG